MAARQLVTAHNAAMDCYRRAMIGEQSFVGRHENLTQAIKLCRTWNRSTAHRGKGKQKVTVEHVHVHSGGQAIVGSVEPQGRSNRVSDPKGFGVESLPIGLNLESTN